MRPAGRWIYQRTYIIIVYMAAAGRGLRSDTDRIYLRKEWEDADNFDRG